MIYPVQIRAARALLNWSQQEGWPTPRPTARAIASALSWRAEFGCEMATSRVTHARQSGIASIRFWRYGLAVGGAGTAD